MCFPNENKRSPTGLRQSSSGIWDQIKGCCGGWKKKWNGFWGEMYQVIKLLLYIYLNSICSRGVCEDFTSVKDKYASGNFSLREDSLIHFSETWAHSNFLENEKLFQQQVKRNLGSFTLMMCCQARCHRKVCSIKSEQRDSRTYCLSMSSNRGWNVHPSRCVL